MSQWQERVKLKVESPSDDEDNGFGSTVRYATVVTKVRYREKSSFKKTKNWPKWEQKNPNKPRKKPGGFDTAVRYAPVVTKVRYGSKK